MGSQGRKQYTVDVKREAVRLVTQQGYSVAEAAKNLGVNAGVLRRWKPELGRTGPVAFPGKGHQTPEQAELHRLREENRRLRMERDILKKPWPSSRASRDEVRLHSRGNGRGIR